ncbi:hypothetical protein DMENIID0001_028840 [Sergentomyia squamirostris]
MTENIVLLGLKQRYMWGGVPFHPNAPSDAANSALELLRLNIQETFSKEVLGIVSKFREKYFLPAMKNIKENLGEQSITEEQIHRVCVALLVGAKDFLETKYSEEEETCQPESSGSGGVSKNLPRKRKEADSEGMSPPKRPTVSAETATTSGSRQKLLKCETNFVLDSQASKVFEREKIHQKHPELSQYLPDYQDREWLVSLKIIPTRNAPAIFLLHEELLKLAESRSEYRNFIKVSDLQTFRLPEFIIKRLTPALPASESAKTLHLKAKSSLSSSHATLSALLAKQSADPTTEDT